MQETHYFSDHVVHSFLLDVMLSPVSHQCFVVSILWRSRERNRCRPALWPAASWGFMRSGPPTLCNFFVSSWILPNCLNSSPSLSHAHPRVNKSWSLHFTWELLIINISLGWPVISAIWHRRQRQIKGWSEVQVTPWHGIAISGHDMCCA